MPSSAINNVISNITGDVKNKHMLSLGDYRFMSDKNPYQEINKSREYVWAERDRLGRASQLQFKGRKSDTVTLQLQVVVSSDNDSMIVSDIEKIGENGKPMFMILSDGPRSNIMGEWVVTSIRVNKTELTYNGTALINDVSLSIREFVR